MDLRILKTHKVIRQAFIDLLSTQDYSAITIQDILNKAMVNRATFYKYYRGKNDLAGQMIDDFKMQLTQILLDRLTADGQVIKDIMENHGQNIFELRKQILALWKIRTKRHNLYQDMFDMSKQNYIALAKQQGTIAQQSPDMLDYQATMMATLFMASCQYYFEKDLPLPKDLADQWQQMVDTAKL